MTTNDNDHFLFIIQLLQNLQKISEDSLGLRSPRLQIKISRRLRKDSDHFARHIENSKCTAIKKYH